MTNKFRIREEKDGFFYVEELKALIKQEKVITNPILYWITFGCEGFHYETKEDFCWITHYHVYPLCKKGIQFNSLKEAKEYIKRQIELPKFHDYDK